MITFDDVLLLPQFSEVQSRADCNTQVGFMGTVFTTPIMSANMDTITNEVMANKMSELGGVGVLHRFQTIEQNVEMFKKSPDAWCSFGIGVKELDRVNALIEAGCTKFVLDVAHGASKVAAEQYIGVKTLFQNKTTFITVGNFATGPSIKDFVKYCLHAGVMVPNAFKVGIGGGSMCTTRVVTGVGVPQLEALMDCVGTGYNIIADGGIRNSGDYAKALAVGAKAVMVGSLLSGTTETPGELIEITNGGYVDGYLKKYRGSASSESYEVQGKTADHRSAEGESTLVPYKGSAEGIIKQLQAGLKSSMSYTGAKNLQDFRERAIMVKVSGNTQRENGAYGK